MDNNVNIWIDQANGDDVLLDINRVRSIENIRIDKKISTEGESSFAFNISYKTDDDPENRTHTISYQLGNEVNLKEMTKYAYELVKLTGGTNYRVQKDKLIEL